MKFEGNNALYRGLIKKGTAFISAMAMALLVAGCGTEVRNVSTISIDGEGRISYSIFEDFNEEYYDLEELSEMVSEEVSAYNSEYISPKVTLESTELIEEENGKKAMIVMTFESSSDFSHFNQEALYYGTVHEAIEKGYELSKSLVNAEGEQIDSAFYDDNGDNHLIITANRANIIAPHNILYMTDGVVLNSKKEADLAEAPEGTVQLLLSK